MPPSHHKPGADRKTCPCVTCRDLRRYWIPYYPWSHPTDNERQERNGKRDIDRVSTDNNYLIRWSFNKDKDNPRYILYSAKCNEEVGYVSLQANLYMDTLEECIKYWRREAGRTFQVDAYLNDGSPFVMLSGKRRVNKRIRYRVVSAAELMDRILNEERLKNEGIHNIEICKEEDDSADSPSISLSYADFSDPESIEEACSLAWEKWIQ